jgi:hypothetical protein
MTLEQIGAMAFKDAWGRSVDAFTEKELALLKELDLMLDRSSI